jgi:hypothetical protein
MAHPRANPHTRHWRGWYKLAIWHSTRRQQLQREPLCRICKDAGRITAAVEVDHIIEHGGDKTTMLIVEHERPISSGFRGRGIADGNGPHCPAWFARDAQPY